MKMWLENKKGMGGRERGRGRERDTHTHTHTHTQRQIERHRHTDRQTDRDREEGRENKWKKKGKLYYLIISHHVMSKVFLPASTVVVSQFGVVVSKKTSVLFRFNAPFSSKTVICELCA